MIESIAVCGAGTMGSGIAQVAAQSGFHTLLFDVNADAVERAKKMIAASLDTLVTKGKIDSAEKNLITERIVFINDTNDCLADVIIEAIIEKTDAKVSLFNRLAEVNHSDVIFATNTSSLSVSEIQSKIKQPERVVGMHFFNPAQVMKLVEIVKGKKTKEEVASQAFELAKRFGKIPVMCKDAPGFIVNRVARHYYLEAMKLVEDGVADFEDIDKIMEASGFKMGPFKLMDLIGMDINLAVSESIYEAFNKAERFKPSDIQRNKVKKGELGKKTGRGFYEYG